MKIQVSTLESPQHGILNDNWRIDMASNQHRKKNEKWIIYGFIVLFLGFFWFMMDMLNFVQLIPEYMTYYIMINSMIFIHAILFLLFFFKMSPERYLALSIVNVIISMSIFFYNSWWLELQGTGGYMKPQLILLIGIGVAVLCVSDQYKNYTAAKQQKQQPYFHSSPPLYPHNSISSLTEEEHDH